MNILVRVPGLKREACPRNHFIFVSAISEYILKIPHFTEFEEC